MPEVIQNCSNIFLHIENHQYFESQRFAVLPDKLEPEFNIVTMFLVFFLPCSRLNRNGLSTVHWVFTHNLSDKLTILRTAISLINDTLTVFSSLPSFINVVVGTKFLMQ